MKAMDGWSWAVCLTGLSCSHTKMVQEREARSKRNETKTKRYEREKQWQSYTTELYRMSSTASFTHTCWSRFHSCANLQGTIISNEAFSF